MNDRSALFHPLTLVRVAGLIDGASLLLLLCIAMPLKYWADMPLAVTIVGTAHGGIFIVYLLAVLYAQVRLQWHVKWTLLSVLAGFVPVANFVLERYFRKNRDRFPVRPFPIMWLVYAIVLFTFIDLFTQLPVMSTYAAALGAGAALAGFVVGMYSLSNTFGNVFSGMMTDKYGAYPVLSAGLLLSSVSLLLYGAVVNVTGLVLLRFLHGFCSGLIVPAAFTYVANQTRSEKQGSRSAITGSFVGIAAIIGPAYSGIMASRTSVPFVFTTVAGLGILLFVLAVIFLPAQQVIRSKKKNSGAKLTLNGGMIRAYLGAFFLMFSQGALAYLLPQHVESLGYSSRLSGMLLSMFGVVAVAIFLMPTNKLFDRIPPVRSFAIGLGLMGISQLLLSQSNEMLVLYAVMSLYGLGFAFLFPSINTLLTQATPKEQRGRAYGIFYALFSAGTVVGSSGLGLLPVSFKHQFMVTGVALLTCVVGVVLTERHREPESSSINAES